MRVWLRRSALVFVVVAWTVGGALANRAEAGFGGIGMAPGAGRGALIDVHRKFDYHCHSRRGYQSWCHQGERPAGGSSWRDGRRYEGRPYYPRESYRRRYWPREYYRRRDDRDRPYWRRRPEREGPSIYQTI